MKEIPKLQTPRLLLRGFREEDLDSYANFCSDPEVMRYIGEGRPISRDQAWRSMAMMIGHWHLRGYGNWAVEDRITGEMIGRLGFWNPDGWPGFELGWLIRQSSWGRGLATEGAHAALEYAFSELNQTRVISLIRPGNGRSIKVAEKLGEKYEGTIELLGSEALLYAIDIEDWKADRG